MTRPRTRTRTAAGVGAIAACAALACLMVGGCVPRVAEPERAPPPPVATPTPPQTPAPPIALEVPTPTYANWMDAPQTAGDWHYTSEVLGSRQYTSAEFRTPGGEVLFAMRCTPAPSIKLERPSGAVARAGMTIRTETATRTLVAPRDPEGRAVVAAVLPPADGLLDAMAFSKGRFAVEVTGEPALYVPAWPEVTRVIEDCR